MELRIAKHGKFKLLGTRHCFNRIADSQDEFLSVRTMSDAVALDPKAHTVTVNGGISYGQLCPYLDKKGFTAARANFRTQCGGRPAQRPSGSHVRSIELCLG